MSLTPILVSVRQDHQKDYHEIRDSLDVAWYSLLKRANLYPIIIPNNTEFAHHIVNHTDYAGLLLTGGNSLAKYGGNAVQRDDTETYLIDTIIKEKKPLMGVCRGMQMLLDYFGNTLEEVEGHVAAEHPLSDLDASPFGQYAESLKQVNSYHNQGAYSANSFKVIARANDQLIEAIQHTELPIFGMMWHPERDPEHLEVHAHWLKNVFGSNND